MTAGPKCTYWTDGGSRLCDDTADRIFVCNDKIGQYVVMRCRLHVRHRPIEQGIKYVEMDVPTYLVLKVMQL